VEEIITLSKGSKIDSCKEGVRVVDEVAEEIFEFEGD
jgi:hypothetical protein